ncbi:MAG: hypothetical protein ACPLW4_00695 [Nitrososphaeria archaeon]
MFYVNVKQMLKEIIKEDKLLERLIDNGNITKKQLDYIIVRKKLTGKMKDILIQTDKGKISKSAYSITKDRGVNNIKKSFYTLILAYYLDIIAKDSFIALEKVTNIINNVKGRTLTKEQVNDVVKTLESIFDQLISI